MTDKNEQISPDVLIIFLISVLVLLIPLGELSKGPAWFRNAFWIFFMIASIAYVFYTHKKPDAATLAVCILTGPVAFYFFTIYGAWCKYYKWPKTAQKKRIAELKKLVAESDLEVGFDWKMNPDEDSSDFLEAITLPEGQLAWKVISKKSLKNRWWKVAVAKDYSCLNKRMERKKAINEDGVISAANLPEELTITDPFDRNFLMGLPKEALVETIYKLRNGLKEK